MSKIKFVAVGDNLLHSHVYNSCKRNDGSFDFDGLYEPVRELIQSADIAAVNQETVFVGDPKNYSSFPFFGTPPQVGDALVKAGFTVVTSATNHTMDKGLAGLKYTLDYWASKHPKTTLLGIHDTRDRARKIRRIKRNGITLSMFNYTRSLNYHHRPLGASYMVDLLKPRYKNKIRNELLKARGASDIVVVFAHWGIEYDYAVCDLQNMWTELFSECGVDIVIGTHPHVIQPMVKIKRADGNDMVVFYSLGNFISGQKKVPRLLGGLADITIIKEDGKARLGECKLLPLITHVGPEGSSYTVYPLADYNDELGAQNHIGKITDYEVSQQSLMDLYEKILRGEIAGEPHSKIDNIKAAVKNLIKENI